jgi:hypothetical protein
MQRSNHDRKWSSEKRSSDARLYKATARQSRGNCIRRMRGRIAMIISIVTVLAVIPLQATYAGNSQVKFSDPDLQVNGVPACPATAIACTVLVSIRDIAVTALECPKNKGQDDPGCNVSGHERLRVADVNADLDECTNGGSCKVKIPDVFTLEELAAAIDSGLLVVRNYNDGTEICVAIVPRALTVNLTGQVCRDPACTSVFVGANYFTGTSTFDPLFTGALQDELCVHGNFRAPLDLTCGPPTFPCPSP